MSTMTVIETPSVRHENAAREPDIVSETSKSVTTSSTTCSSFGKSPTRHPRNCKDPSILPAHSAASCPQCKSQRTIGAGGCPSYELGTLDPLSPRPNQDNQDNSRPTEQTPTTQSADESLAISTSVPVIGDWQTWADLDADAKKSCLGQKSPKLRMGEHAWFIASSLEAIYETKIKKLLRRLIKSNHELIYQKSKDMLSYDAFLLGPSDDGIGVRPVILLLTGDLNLGKRAQKIIERSRQWQPYNYGFVIQIDRRKIELKGDRSPDYREFESLASSIHRVNYSSRDGTVDNTFDTARRITESDGNLHPRYYYSSPHHARDSNYSSSHSTPTVWSPRGVDSDPYSARDSNHSSSRSTPNVWRSNAPLRDDVLPVKTSYRSFKPRRRQSRTVDAVTYEAAIAKITSLFENGAYGAKKSPDSNSDHLDLTSSDLSRVALEEQPPKIPLCGTTVSAIHESSRDRPDWAYATVGGIVQIKDRHYALTVAHCLFPEGNNQFADVLSEVGDDDHDSLNESDSSRDLIDSDFEDIESDFEDVDSEDESKEETVDRWTTSSASLSPRAPIIVEFYLGHATARFDFATENSVDPPEQSYISIREVSPVVATGLGMSAPGDLGKSNQTKGKTAQVQETHPAPQNFSGDAKKLVGRLTCPDTRLISSESDWALVPISDADCELHNLFYLPDGRRVEICGISDTNDCSDRVYIASGISGVKEVSFLGSSSSFVFPWSKKVHDVFTIGHVLEPGESGAWVFDAKGFLYGIAFAAVRDLETTYLLRASDVFKDIQHRFGMDANLNALLPKLAPSQGPESRSVSTLAPIPRSLPLKGSESTLNLYKLLQSNLTDHDSYEISVPSKITAEFMDIDLADFYACANYVKRFPEILDENTEGLTNAVRRASALGMIDFCLRCIRYIAMIQCCKSAARSVLGRPNLVRNMRVGGNHHVEFLAAFRAISQHLLASDTSESEQWVGTEPRPRRPWRSDSSSAACGAPNASSHAAVYNSYGVNSPTDDVLLLDPRFSTRQKAFFQPGRVFKVLWHEQAGATHDTTTMTFDRRFNEPIHTGVRWMLVIQSKSGHCICCPISTYVNRAATKKPSMEAIEAHAIIYASDTEPMAFSGKPLFSKPPIPLDLSSHGTIHRNSCVNFSQFHTVEYNRRVFDVGMVRSDYVRYIQQCAMDEFL